ncbi:MAG TPA: TonB-dependent receptor, partial [Opitutaceae bacterium]|nr:TonB-dependent receptor [Opitutaceae bacterium]
MKPIKLLCLAARACAALVGLCLLTSPASAQTSGTGVVEGRVLNTTNGNYLNNARVTVEGTQLETFTDAGGNYRFNNVPAGETKVTAFYTGLKTETSLVTVQAGQTASMDFKLNTGDASKEGEEIKLDQFIVESRKEFNGSAIAINEQRFAPTIKNVVASDSFGDVTEGNLGEFVKFLPGVTVDYTSPDARTISIRGVAANYTSIYVDGFKIASADSSTAGRTFELEQVSINNTARVEVAKSRTPDIPADALGGSVNMISKNASESSKPQLTYRAYASMNGDSRSLGKSPGPGSEASVKIKPGADLTFTDPVSKNFGFVVNVLDSNIFYPQHRTNPQWAPNGTTGANTGPVNPYLRKYQLQDGPKNTNRQSYGFTADWKISPIDSINIALQDNFYNSFFGNRNLNWDTGSTVPTSFSPDGTQGAVGKGAVSWGSSFRRKLGVTYMIDSVYKHRGPTWDIEAGASFSHASNHYHDVQDGHFENVGLSIPNVTVGYSGMTANNYVRPGTITVTNAAGAAVDTSSLSNYQINSATTNEADSTDLFKSARLDVKRDIGLSFPFTVKAGLFTQQETRDIRKPNTSYAFVGPDGKAGTADDNAGLYNIVDYNYSGVPLPYGFSPVQYPSPYALYSLYKAHPEYFQLNQAGAIQNSVNNSLYLQEVISAAYLMGDARLMNNRLRTVAGIRFEQTNDKGAGPLVNPKITNTDPVQQALQRYTDRGAHSKVSYNGFYPSINLSYDITSNLIARAAYGRAVGRPDLANIIPSVALPDPTGTQSNVVTTANPLLKPEQANNYDVSLEYYFEPVGLVSIGAFRKDFTNFFSTLTQDLTPALASQLNLPPEFGGSGYQVKSTFNSGTAHITGLEASYSQALKFLPIWASG